MSELAREMLKQVGAIDNPDHEPTVKLDKDTLRIVSRWKLQNLKSTVAWLCKVADEALSEAQQDADAPPQR